MNDTDLDEPDDRSGGLPAFLAARRNGWFPTIPPGVEQVLAALDAAEQLRRELLSRPVESLAGYVATTVAAVTAGQALPDVDSFVAGAHEAAVAAERQAAASNALPAITNQLQARAAHAIADAIPALLDPLRAELNAVLTEARSADQALGDLDIADPGEVAAATAEQRAALLALGDLVQRYNRLRHAQRSAYAGTGQRPPGWSDVVVGLDWAGAVYGPQLHEFADTRGRGTVASVGSKVARLRLIARRRDTWVPTLEELDEAYAAIHRSEAQAAEHAAAAALAGAA